MTKYSNALESALPKEETDALKISIDKKALGTINKDVMVQTFDAVFNSF